MKKYYTTLSALGGLDNDRRHLVALKEVGDLVYREQYPHARKLLHSVCQELIRLGHAREALHRAALINGITDYQKHNLLSELEVQASQIETLSWLLSIEAEAVITMYAARLINEKNPLSVILQQIGDVIATREKTLRSGKETERWEYYCNLAYGCR